MKTHDPTTWARRDHYEWYRGLDFPYLGLTANVDVTRLMHLREEQGLSLFAGMLHRLIRAANGVDALRQRIRVIEGREQVVEHELIHPGFTVAGAAGLFSFAAVDFDSDRDRFAAAVEQASQEKRHATSLRPFEGTRDDLIFCSCLPWVDFTHVTHPVPTSRIDSVPRIAWGRFVTEGAHTRCAVNIQVHHALVDGAHVGAFFEHLAAPDDG